MQMRFSPGLRVPGSREPGTTSGIIERRQGLSSPEVSWIDIEAYRRQRVLR
jgi:hypothetical protein